MEAEWGAVERDRGSRCASVVKTYSSTSNGKSLASAKSKKRYLNISARKKESILQWQGNEVESSSLVRNVDICYDCFN